MKDQFLRQMRAPRDLTGVMIARLSTDGGTN